MKSKKKSADDFPLWKGLSRWDKKDYTRPDTPLDMVLPAHIVTENGGSNYLQHDDRVIEFDDVDVPGAINIKPEKAPLRVHRVDPGKR